MPEERSPHDTESTLFRIVSDRRRRCGGAVRLKFDASESWEAEPSLPLCISFDGLELLPPKMPEWGKPPVVYSLREAGSQKTPGNPEQIAFEAELLSGGGATLGLCLQDADGEFFAYPRAR